MWNPGPQRAMARGARAGYTAQPLPSKLLASAVPVHSIVLAGSLHLTHVLMTCLFGTSEQSAYCRIKLLQCCSPGHDALDGILHVRGRALVDALEGLLDGGRVVAGEAAERARRRVGTMGGSVRQRYDISEKVSSGRSEASRSLTTPVQACTFYDMLGPREQMPRATLE